MKKILFVFAAILSLSVLTARADNDKIINKGMLPAVAQNFIDTHFSGLKISYAKEERDFLEHSYEVVFADGSKLEFTRKGAWKDVDCRYSEVPAAIVPAAISNYVKANYPDAKILKIERDSNDYEVKLSNRFELTFDKKFNIIDIDN
ncbi:MAG: PepSY-like domain-containing protein [Bacteroidaceae bacterium]|nr:PepSY-like domain-containing protein [Bacteroidaceae bacterium]